MTVCTLCHGSGVIRKLDSNREPYAFPCGCQKIRMHTLKTGRLRAESSLPPLPIEGYDLARDYISRSPALQQAAVARLRELPAKLNTGKQSFYLQGQPSTQKSTVASWIGHTLIEQFERSVSYVLMDTLIKSLIALPFKAEGSGLEEMVTRWKTADCLIIDEAFSKSMTVYSSKGPNGASYQVAFLESFLRERLEVDRKPVLFISHIPVTTISKVMTQELQEFIRRSTTTIEMTDSRFCMASELDKPIFKERTE